MTARALTTILALILAIIASPVLAAAPHRQPAPLIQGLSHSVTWKPGQPTATLKLHFHNSVRPLSMRIGFDHPNGTIVDVVFKAAAVNLLFVRKENASPTGFEPFDDLGTLKEGCRIQVGEWKVRGNANPLIVVAVGDGLTDLVVWVFRLHPPAIASDAVRWENWEQVGNFAGQQDATIKGDVITLPFGSAGLFTEYPWVTSKFVETDDLQH